MSPPLQRFNNYYISGHKNLLDLSREVGSVKRSFSEVKQLTSRDLTQLQGDLSRFAHLLSTACHATNTRMSYGDKVRTGGRSKSLLEGEKDRSQVLGKGREREKEREKVALIGLAD